MKPDISIIILNYNAEVFLKDCLKSVQEQRSLTIETIVVDNKSTDQSAEMVKTNFPNVKYIQRDTNVGFAAGNNVGVKQATSDLILFLNPDTKFLHPDDLKKCVDKYHATSNIGVLTCRIQLALTDKIDETCHRGFPTPWASFTHFVGLGRLFPNTKLFGQYLMTYCDYGTEHEIDAAGGMFMIVSRKIGEQIKWWDEDYPLYGEDLDFNYKVKELGYKVLYWPEVMVMHYKGVSTGFSKHSKKVTTASKSTTSQVKLWSIQAMELFYDKHYKQKYSPIITWIVKAGIKVMKYKRTKTV
jgi:GT2 family glycosyltransferase